MSVIALLGASAALFIGTCVVLGLVIGSFLNVVIYRLPRMLERQWREQCLEFGATAPPGRAVQSRRAALGMPFLPHADQRRA